MWSIPQESWNDDNWDGLLSFGRATRVISVTATPSGRRKFRYRRDGQRKHKPALSLMFGTNMKSTGSKQIVNVALPSALVQNRNTSIIFLSLDLLKPSSTQKMGI
jgi:hypothetical protein